MGDATRSDVLSPIHVAFHYLGCARSDAEGIHLPSRVGPLIECLGEAVERVTVLAYDPPSAPTLEDGTEYALKGGNVSLLSLGPKGSLRGLLGRRRRVARTIRRGGEDWDVVVFQLPNRRAGLVIRAIDCERVVGLVVGTTAAGAVENAWTLGRRLALRFTRASTEFQQRVVLRRAKLAVVNSHELRTGIVGRIPNTVTVTLSARRARHCFQTTDRFQGAVTNVLVAGRITLEKGVVDAVEAFSVLKRDLPNARLHVAGEGPALEAMLERARSLGVRESLELHGWVPAGDRMSRLYREMDVLLLPSYAGYEGFPYVVWEALAHDVLVVCTPVRGPREVLQDGRDVLFVPFRDPAAMAAAIRRLADDPELRRRLLASGFELARSTSIECTVDELLEAIRATWPDLPPPKAR